MFWSPFMVHTQDTGGEQENVGGGVVEELFEIK